MLGGLVGPAIATGLIAYFYQCLKAYAETEYVLVPLDARGQPAIYAALNQTQTEEQRASYYLPQVDRAPPQNQM